MNSCTVEDLKAALDQKTEVNFVDVRTPAEFQKGHIEGFVNIPLGSDPSRWEALDKKTPRVSDLPQRRPKPDGVSKFGGNGIQ